MKEIKIKSINHKIKLYFDQNFVFKLFKLLFNPVKLFSKFKNLNKRKKNSSEINWKKRVDDYGKYSVIDTQTPKEEFNYVTDFQKKILLGNLRKYLTGKEKRVLDFGCGSGRFSKDLSKLNKNLTVIATDKEKKLIKLAKPSKKIKFIHLKKLNQIKYKFDVIFIANVFGGIKLKELKKISNFLKSKLRKNGIFLLNENVDKRYNGEKDFDYWISRSENFYVNLFKDLSLKKVDEYKYLQNITSVFIGKKKRS